MKKWICALALAASMPAVAQRKLPQVVFTDDVDRFWVAFDSVRSTSDPARQLDYMRNLYVAKGSEGLRAFMRARDYSAERWVTLIGKYPRFWASIRPNTLAVKTKTTEIERSVGRLRKLYPALKDGKIYFTVGGLRSGGTVEGNLVLIGTEIATGDAGTDVSEFPDKWLATAFQSQSLSNVVAVNVHEYVHTQQVSEGTTLLSRALREGACDFIAELTIRQPLETAYLRYGAAHEAELRPRFKQEMFGFDQSAWLYNGADATTVADLGYFMGYAINKAYYQQARNKRQAIREIIELDYASPVAVEAFVKQSGYFPDGWDKAALLSRYPVVVGIAPFAAGATDVAPGEQEMLIQFSQAMHPEATSFAPGPRGMDYFPLKKPLGFSPDGTSYRVLLDVQPQHDYEFLVTTRGFRSRDGVPLLQEYLVNFRTR